MNWPTKKLGEVCDILDSLRKPVTKRDRKPGPYPYYGATGVQDYVADYIFDEPLVLVGEDGAKWGAGERTAYRVEGKYWVNNHAHVLRPHRNILLDNWLVYFLNFSGLSKYITGLTVKKLNQEKMKMIEIPLPPLSEQKRIVEKIEKLFAKIDQAERLRAESLAASTALLPSALHQVFSRAKKGKLIKLGEVIKLQGGYAFKSREYQKIGVPIVRIQNLQNESVDLSDAPCISLNPKKELQEYLLEENDILIAMSGATTGKIAIVKKKDLPALLNQRVGRFRVRDHSKISNNFLFWVVRIIQQKIFESAYGAAQPNISGKDIEKFQIPLPPLSEQKKIVAYLDTLSQKSSELQKLQQQTAADFSALRQSVLAQAFNQDL